LLDGKYASYKARYEDIIEEMIKMMWWEGDLNVIYRKNLVFGTRC
jgi:hypothetical protein